MNHASSICLVLCLLALGSPASAQEPPVVECEAWYDHYVELRSADADYAAALGRADGSQLAEARARYLSDCEQVQTNPHRRSDELAILTCIVAAGAPSELTACLDPRDGPPKPEMTGPLPFLEAIRSAENSFEREFDTFHPCAATPPEVPGATAVPFEGGGVRDFVELGWYPDDPVRCRYSVTVSGDPQGFEAVAECDLDGDGEIAVWRATRAKRAHRVSPAGVE
jgi:hypothetical protein